MFTLTDTPRIPGTGQNYVFGPPSYEGCNPPPVVHEPSPRRHVAHPPPVKGPGTSGEVDQVPGPSDQGNEAPGPSDKGNEAPDEPQEPKESAGRPSRELISAQERSLKDAVSEIRTVSEQLRELFEHIESRITEIDRTKFQHLAESVSFLCAYLEDKLSILLNASTKERDRIHIALVVSVHLEDAANSSDNLKDDLNVDDPVAKRAEDQSSAVRSLIGILSGRLKRLGDEFSKLLSGLLIPKEWTLKGEFGTVVFFAKAGVSVEIKFGP